MTDAAAAAASSTHDRRHPLCEVQQLATWPQLPQSVVDGLTVLGPTSCPPGLQQPPSKFAHPPPPCRRIGWATSTVATKACEIITTIDDTQLLMRFAPLTELDSKMTKAAEFWHSFDPSVKWKDNVFYIKEVNCLPFLITMLYRAYIKLVIYDVTDLELVIEAKAIPTDSKLHKIGLLVIPTVLYFNNKFTHSEWYLKLRWLQTKLKIKIFPLIDVECNMECKEVYLRFLADDAKFQPFNQVSMPLPPHLPAAHSTASSPPFVHLRPHNSLLAPTVILCMRMWPTHNMTNGRQIVKQAIDQLKEEIAAGCWPHSSKSEIASNISQPHDPPAKKQFVLKGCNSSRMSAFESFDEDDIDTIASTCIEWYKDGAGTSLLEPTCCQHFILLQPFLSSLKREVRSYFFHGRHWKTLRTANAVKTKQMLSVSCVERDDAGNVDADLMLQISLPGLVDQAVHALGLLEQRYKLVSSSALLRVDQGVEFVPVVRPLPNSPRSALTDAQKQVVDTAERNAINRRKPQVWMASGSGWITRSFINEVTTSLDILMFSELTAAKAMETFAAHTVRKLLDCMSDAQ